TTLSSCSCSLLLSSFFFFFPVPPPPHIYTLSLHDALPIYNLRQRRDLGHHRLGRAGGAASCPRVGRPRFSPAHPDRGAARRRLSPLHRYACAHRRAGRDSARNSHGRIWHAVLHMASRRVVAVLCVRLI